MSLQRVEEAVVTGKARTTVDGVAIDTWIIQRHVVETGRRGGVEVVSETASTELYAPAVGLPVYRTIRTDVPDAEGTIVTAAAAVELLSSKPA